MPTAQEELHSITQILHLFHHRNKNQHRLAKWYKAFSMLRRHISKLSAELDINIQYTTLSAKAKKTTESRETVEVRVAFLEDVLMERCYLAFSQLIGDNQYAALGLMLMGCLARIKKVIRPLRGKRQVDEEQIEGSTVDGPAANKMQDYGEVVMRGDFQELEVAKDEQPAEDDVEATTKLKRSKKKRLVTTEEAKGPLVGDSETTKRPKKKRKKGDAFDDLFSGLV